MYCSVVIPFIHRWRVVRYWHWHGACCVLCCVCVLYEKLTKQNNLCGCWVVVWCLPSLDWASAHHRIVFFCDFFFPLDVFHRQSAICCVRVAFILFIYYFIFALNVRVWILDDFFFLLALGFFFVLFAYLPLSRDHPISFQFLVFGVLPIWIKFVWEKFELSCEHMRMKQQQNWVR